MKKGFSMVELLVVIAIIMLLVALVLPVYTFVTEQAKQVGCVSNMRTLYTGLAGYAVDHKGNMPYYWDENDLYNNLTATPMWWGYPAIQYIVPDFPGINPYSGKPWSNPSNYNDFSKCIAESYGSGIRDIFFCQAGDNGYFTGAYEGKRVYISNYYGYFGPDGDISHAIGSRRDYQSSSPTGFNRPINTGLDPAGTWLLADYNWSDKNSSNKWKVNTGHHNYSKNILHLNGAVMLTPPQYWVDHYTWFDKFPEN